LFSPKNKPFYESHITWPFFTQNSLFSTEELSFVQIDHKKKIKSITQVSLKIKFNAFINTLEFHFELLDKSNIYV